MNGPPISQPGRPENLERGLSLLEATSLNMTFMVGIGPFIVIPFIIQAMHGPQCIFAWVGGALLALLDGCVWAELGAAMPQAGGSYVFLREAYGPEKFGRLMSFLFIWQTLFQAPLSISSGALGFADYSKYLTAKLPGFATWHDAHQNSMTTLAGGYSRAVAVLVIVIAVVLLYRKISEIGKISTALWVIVLATMLWLIYGGVTHFNAARVFTYSPDTWNLSWVFFAGLGHASVQTIYSYLGYYNVCNLGGEMKNPERNIPRAIFISILGIAILYFALQTSILSVIPWQEAANSKYVVSLFVERTFGTHWASFATAMILFVAFGSIFSATLGYSRVPYAAALDGNFFSIFARVHPVKKFPYVSLLALGAVSIIICAFFSLFSVIRAILAMRCLIQFAGQAVGLLILHRRWKAERWPFHMLFYPVPVILAIAGWIAIFISTGRNPMLSSLAAMAAGIVVYLVRARMARQWPFQEAVR
ncbi:MAG: amino acid permease [Candidatus Acidiferrales bacterium]|jgi:fructoselysine transporter